MYEVMWNVTSFMDKSLFPADGSNPFVYSMNLGGSAAHGDYVFGYVALSLLLVRCSGLCWWMWWNLARFRMFTRDETEGTTLTLRS